MSSRWIVAVVVLLAVAIMVLAGRQLYPPAPDIEPGPVTVATPLPEPFKPPPPEPDEDPPLVVGTVRVCCYGMAPYGHGREWAMVQRAAFLHATGKPEHTHDLFRRGCPSEPEEDAALARVLLRPERIEANSAATLSKADRAAYRDRTGGRR